MWDVIGMGHTRPGNNGHESIMDMWHNEHEA